MPYSRFRGDPAATETTHEYDDAGRLVRSVTLAEPDWSEHDRGLVLALLAERADTCSACGHQISECRNPKTAGTWTVTEQICEPSRVAQAAAENNSEKKKRGVQYLTRRTT